MTFRELTGNKELCAEIDRAIIDEMTKGTNRIDATVNIFKKYDIEFNENDVRGKIISMQELDEDQLDHVSGGGWCLETVMCLAFDKCNSVFFDTDDI